MDSIFRYIISFIIFCLFTTGYAVADEPNHITDQTTTTEYRSVEENLQIIADEALYQKRQREIKFEWALLRVYSQLEAQRTFIELYMKHTAIVDKVMKELNPEKYYDNNNW